MWKSESDFESCLLSTFVSHLTTIIIKKLTLNDRLYSSASYHSIFWEGRKGVRDKRTDEFPRDRSWPAGGRLRPLTFPTSERSNVNFCLLTHPRRDRAAFGAERYNWRIIERTCLTPPIDSTTCVVTLSLTSHAHIYAPKLHVARGIAIDTIDSRAAAAVFIRFFFFSEKESYIVF